MTTCGKGCRPGLVGDPPEAMVGEKWGSLKGDIKHKRELKEKGIGKKEVASRFMVP